MAASIPGSMAQSHKHTHTQRQTDTPAREHEHFTYLRCLLHGFRSMVCRLGRRSRRLRRGPSCLVQGRRFCSAIPKMLASSW